MKQRKPLMFLASFGRILESYRMSNVHLPWYQVRRVEGHSYLPRLLPVEPIIVDLGANHGEFCAAMEQGHKARCIAVEPNPLLASEIEGRGIAERVIEVAVGDRNGSAAFTVADVDVASKLLLSGSPQDSEEIDVRTSTLFCLLDDLCYPRIDILKVDIEGMEVVALTGLKLRQLQTISQITVEFHDVHGYVTSDQIRSTYRHLSKAGFRRFRSSVSDRQDVLFVNSAVLGLFGWACTYVLSIAGAAAQRRIRTHYGRANPYSLSS